MDANVSCYVEIGGYMDCVISLAGILQSEFLTSPEYQSSLQHTQLHFRLPNSFTTCLHYHNGSTSQLQLRPSSRWFQNSFLQRAHASSKNYAPKFSTAYGSHSADTNFSSAPQGTMYQGWY
ncbi:hypothetical protein BDN70DRAFT_888175, partial [Pholiota conissans]